ncbi:MAG TPA: translation initiation factor IF-2 [Bacteroidales bacterium]|nr:translation initiation factor IF-2 [Bacteroidales bacterium]HNS46146.1 translation initiation factor IF-2 [Bacteroidales bacterium]
MEETSKVIRLVKAAKEFNIGITTIVEFLKKKGHHLEESPNAKLTSEMYALLMNEFQSEKFVKEEADKIGLDYSDHHTISIDDRMLKEVDKEGSKDQSELIIKSISFDYEDYGYEDVKTRPSVGKAAEPVRKVAKKEAESPKEAPEAPPTVKKEAEEAREEKAGVLTGVPPADEAPADGTELITADLSEAKTKTTEEETTEPEVIKAKKGLEPKLKILGQMELDKLTGKRAKKVDRPARPAEEVPVAEKEAEAQPSPEPAPAEVSGTPVSQTPAQTEAVDAGEKEVKAEEPPVEKSPRDDVNFIRVRTEKLAGPTILGTIELPEVKKPEKKKPVASSSDEQLKAKKKRKRIRKPSDEKDTRFEERKTEKTTKPRFKDRHIPRDHFRPEVSEDEIQKQIKETLQRLSATGKSKASKYRKIKREMVQKLKMEEEQKIEEGKKVIKVTEFVTANELATMMNVPVTQIISTCMTLGLFVSINQRLDAETLAVVADEFGYKVEFVSVEVQEAILHTEETDRPEDLEERAPIVTVMGHVDHGKTSLLDYIRHANVIAGEAGGITQHIGAYEVMLENGKSITFLDTPGHEAFTAMRARGAMMTDVVIIVVAADDNIMPQTVEAINHAQAAGVPIVFAINKIDKPNANTEKIREQLAKMNILVEDWGGKYQCQEISAKKGTNIDLLLDKVLLESEVLELKANSKKPATGAVIESSLDKGRGYIAKLLVQEGSMKVGDIVLAGAHFGKVKAMYNERNQIIKVAGPSKPILLLGLNGAPQAGDRFNVLPDERDAKAIANKRLQLQREQGLRTQKHITLDEIGRRIAIGDFKELNLIVKGDVDGSVEALSDSLLKLSNEEVQVNVIHKSVGQITESDVLLASASNAVIIGFNVRPSLSARKLAEQEQIDMRLYSIIYNAINEIKDAIEGMLAPDIEEKILCNVEVREVFKITKVGSIAGCIVLDGKITRNTKIRVIRDGIVVYEGQLGSLKRFKEDVKEVSSGYECGLSIENYNDIKAGDIIEGYEQREVKRKL